MVIILLVIGIIIGYIRKGKINNLANFKIRLLPLIILSFLIQLSIYFGYQMNISLIMDYAVLLHFISYIILFVGLMFNFENKWFIFITLGVIANFMVIFLNQGRMPVSGDAAAVAGFTESLGNMLASRAGTHQLLMESTILPFLADILPVALPKPLDFFNNIYSIGDIILYSSVIGLLQSVMVRDDLEDEEEEDYDILNEEEELQIIDEPYLDEVYKAPSIGEMNNSDITKLNIQENDIPVVKDLIDRDNDFVFNKLSEEEEKFANNSGDNFQINIENNEFNLKPMGELDSNDVEEIPTVQSEFLYNNFEDIEEINEGIEVDNSYGDIYNEEPIISEGDIETDYIQNEEPVQNEYILEQEEFEDEIKYEEILELGTHIEEQQEEQQEEEIYSQEEFRINNNEEDVKYEETTNEQEEVQDNRYEDVPREEPDTVHQFIIVDGKIVENPNYRKSSHGYIQVQGEMEPEDANENIINDEVNEIKMNQLNLNEDEIHLFKDEATHALLKMSDNERVDLMKKMKERKEKGYNLVQIKVGDRKISFWKKEIGK